MTGIQGDNYEGLKIPLRQREEEAHSYNALNPILINTVTLMLYRSNKV